MPVDERLAELLRQRDLVRNHLAWLEEEIKRADGMPMRRPIEPVEPPAVANPKEEVSPEEHLARLHTDIAPNSVSGAEKALFAGAVIFLLFVVPALLLYFFFWPKGDSDEVMPDPPAAEMHTVTPVDEGAEPTP